MFKLKLIAGDKKFVANKELKREELAVALTTLLNTKDSFTIEIKKLGDKTASIPLAIHTGNFSIKFAMEKKPAAVKKQTVKKQKAKEKKEKDGKEK